MGRFNWTIISSRIHIIWICKYKALIYP